MFEISFLCNKCKKILSVSVDTLNYDKTKILKKNKWVETEDNFKCDKCKNINTYSNIRA